MNTSYISTIPTYPALTNLLRTAAGLSWESRLEKTVIPYLISVWLRHYRMSLSGGNVVEVPLGQYSYLFDIGPDRLIAAWGISAGRFAGDRPSCRIAGHPVANRNIYDAGHAISHRLGGGTDINLAAQLASVNRKAFQQLERSAVKNPGSLYFTYWMYCRTGRQIQLASRIQQGLVSQNTDPQIRDFKN